MNTYEYKCKCKYYQAICATIKHFTKSRSWKIDAITDSSSPFFFCSQDHVDTTLLIVKGTLQVQIIHSVIQIT